MLTKEYVAQTCKCGQGGAATCRYLSFSQGVWGCVKGHPSLRRVIDERFTKGEMGARGDNCAGVIDPHKAVLAALSSFHRDILEETETLLVDEMVWNGLLLTDGFDGTITVVIPPKHFSHSGFMRWAHAMAGAEFRDSEVEPDPPEETEATFGVSGIKNFEDHFDPQRFPAHVVFSHVAKAEETQRFGDDVLQL